MNQTEEKKMALKEEFNSLFGSGKKRPRKTETEYMREWEMQIVRLDNAMRYFDPNASRGLAETMRKVAYGMLEKKENELMLDAEMVLRGYGIDPDTATAEDVRAIPAEDRRPIAERDSELQSVRKGLGEPAKDFDYISNLQGKIGDILEGARELYAEVSADPGFTGSHLEEGMRDFCGFVEGVHSYIGRLLDGEGRASAAVDMIHTTTKYSEAYSLDGVPNRTDFSNMIGSCRVMAKKVWDEAVSNVMYRK